MKNLKAWLSSVSKDGSSWEGNNIHIDEIEGFESIKRDKWVEASFSVFNDLSRLKLSGSLILFLHIELSESTDRVLLDTLSLEWLGKNIDEYTPPSFNCTSKKYYNDFYQKELVKCAPDSKLMRLVGPSLKLEFFFRTCFDEIEEIYSREIYVFRN